MAWIHKEIRIEADPRDVWSAVSDVGAAHRRLTPGILTDARLDGDNARIVTFADGTVARELIVALDNQARRFAYASVGGRAIHHNASFQVFDDGDGCTRLVWITDVLPDELASFVGQRIELGSAVIKQTLEQR
ncbi:SRPBCC family protein [Dyella dinghuensis]|uniref:SRPBCC family protein n=1 Tax=Dyella dinghuensis TaxID=1920169 RepID=A0A3S0QYB7_9GAMM|nr:SRPBCC family protein [Dyella dinghuensis]RUL65826.1 SRPBCC family protein [Dyella dinghuensis]